MKNQLYTLAIAGLITGALFTSCRRDVDTGILNTGNFTDTAGALKDFAAFPMGVAVGFTPMFNEPRYANIISRDFNEAVLENDMKHSSIVQDNGGFNWSRTDQLVNALGSTRIFGHVLGWHSQQNASYLKNFAGIVIPAATELLTNPGFEGGLNTWSTFNSGNPAGTSTITTGSGTAEIRTGSGSMKVINPVAYPGNQWRVQVAGPMVNTVVGQSYTFSYWVRATAAGGSIRLSTATEGGGSSQFQGDQTIGTTWQLISWTITANSPRTRVLFDMGQAANTYLIDDASFREVVPTPNPTLIASKLDEALKTWIYAIAGRYKGKVKAWDVINELFTGNGSIRNNANTDNTPSHVLVWSHYMGKDFAYKAFQYAREADPEADLYINDFNLEREPQKLDSLIALVNDMKARGLKVDGIGTQMHISWNADRGLMEQHFRKLGATGLKIRISELDIATVAGSAAGGANALNNGYQASMAQFVVEMYLKHVPAAQRGGITLWGVNDGNSWRSNGGREFALFYDDNFAKKPSYAGLLNGLKMGGAK
ncbi:MAG: endo-1,4-beta-xylanase [Chitinophagaceae bacterium]|nr:endo-1,4-beta-xylanase [Chitinophagaceae bacterium]